MIFNKKGMQDIFEYYEKMWGKGRFLVSQLAN